MQGLYDYIHDNPRHDPRSAEINARREAAAELARRGLPVPAAEAATDVDHRENIANSAG